jgi:ribosomal protein S18 acetylase RimI-like enzyme
MDGGAGHCLCGSVSYRFDGPPNWQAHCHCESCRRNCSAPFTSYFGVSHGKWRWTGTAPQVYVSSPGVRRHFCATCGTPMAFEGENWAHEIHFYAASLNDPSAFEPTLHVNWNEHLPWVKLDDGLKRMRMPRRMRPEEDFGPVLALIRAAFAYMEGRIDPPSSVHRLTADALSARAANEEIWVLEDLAHPIACVVLTPEADHLYLGKLAVAEDCRGQGLARQLVRHAMARATALGLPELRLQTRVELEENQRAFAAMGFSETGRTAHEGHDRPTSISFALRV